MKGNPKKIRYYSSNESDLVWKIDNDKIYIKWKEWNREADEWICSMYLTFDDLRINNPEVEEIMEEELVLMGIE